MPAGTRTCPECENEFANKNRRLCPKCRWKAFKPRRDYRKEYSKYRAKNLARARRNYPRNRDKIMQGVQRYYRANREARLRYGRAYYRKHKEFLKQQVKAWHKANPEKRRAIMNRYARKKIRGIFDGYVRRQLRVRNVPITPENIERQRTKIKVLRMKGSLIRSRNTFSMIATVSTLGHHGTRVKN